MLEYWNYGMLGQMGPKKVTLQFSCFPIIAIFQYSIIPSDPPVSLLLNPQSEIRNDESA